MPDINLVAFVSQETSFTPDIIKVHVDNEGARSTGIVEADGRIKLSMDEMQRAVLTEGSTVIVKIRRRDIKITL